MRTRFFCSVLLVGLVFLCPHRVSAQRCLPAQKAIQFDGGIVDGFTLRQGDGRTSIFGGIHYSRYNRNKTRWVAGLEILEKDYIYRNGVVPKVQFTADCGYYIPVLADRGRNVILSFGASVIAGYETTNWGHKLLPDGARITDADCSLWGGALTAEIEAFVSNRVALLLSCRERILGGSTVGTFHTQVGIGVKIIIN